MAQRAKIGWSPRREEPARSVEYRRFIEDGKAGIVQVSANAVHTRDARTARKIAELGDPGRAQLYRGLRLRT